MKKSLNKIPTDIKILFNTHDKIFQNKHNFSKLLQANEIDNENDSYKFHENPLSFYNDVNIDAISISPAAGFNTFSPSSGFNFMEKNAENENFNFNSFASNKNNLLIQRRTVSFNNKGYFKSDGNILTQKQKLMKNNFNFSHDVIKKAFLPPSDDKIYPKYFLPEAGFGILSKPIEQKEKKQKKLRVKTEK